MTTLTTLERHCDAFYGEIERRAGVPRQRCVPSLPRPTAADVQARSVPRPFGTSLRAHSGTSSLAQFLPAFYEDSATALTIADAGGRQVQGNNSSNR